MAQKKVTRKELLKEPDQFLSFSTRMLQWLAARKIYFLGALATVLVLVAAFSGYQYYQVSAEEKSFERMRELVQRYQDAASAEGTEAAFQKLGAEFQNFIQMNSGRQGGRLARISLADYAYKAGDFENAASLYEKALESVELYPSLKMTVLSGLAYAYEGKNDLTRAAQTFERIVAEGEAFFKSDAYYHLGLIRAAQGDAEKSREVFNKLLEEFPAFMYANQIRDRLGLEG